MSPDPDSPALRRHSLNGDLAERAFRRGASLALHRPVEVYLQIASACNLDCYMCTEHNRPPHLRRGHGLRSLPPELFAKIEREVLPWSARLFLGVGGEPTISEHFTEYVERGALCEQEIGLTTNGTRLEREEIADVVARHVRRVQISIDAATPETYERIRRGSRWGSLRRGLALLQRRRSELGTQERCHVTFTFVLMRSNVDELPAFVDLAREAGADAVWAQHVIPVTDDARDEPLIAEPERYNRVLERARERSEALGLPLDAPLPYPLPGAAATPAGPSRPAASSARIDSASQHAIPCRFPTHSLFVLYDGRVFPCCHPFAHQKMQVGDLSRQGFAEIWNGSVYRNLRAGLKGGDAPPICRGCSLAHDPPLAYEDPQRLLAGPQLEEFYRGRELDPPAGLDPLAWLVQAGWMDWADEMQQHAGTLGRHVGNLEHERTHMSGHIANLERERADLRARIEELRGIRGAFRFAGRALTGPLVRKTLGLDGRDERS